LVPLDDDISTAFYVAKYLSMMHGPNVLHAYDRRWVAPFPISTRTVLVWYENYYSEFQLKRGI